MDVLEAIKARRSIRHYRPDPVDDERLQTVLDAAHWAPSWKNRQCWRFVVVHDSGVREALADTLLQMGEDGQPSPNPAAKAIRAAPVTIVACAELGKSGYTGDKPDTDKGDWFMFDVALAMQNLVLAAHSLGLGTVIVGAFDAEKAARVLQIPEGYSIVAMTPLGFPAREPRPGSRRDLSQLVYHERYGQP